MQTYNNLAGPFNCLATNNAAVDFVYALSFCINTKEFKSLVASLCAASNVCPVSPCKEANRKIAAGSCLITYCTDWLHKLQTPSKSMTGFGLFVCNIIAKFGHLTFT